MPVHEVHALANSFGTFHARQASPECSQVDFQNILLVVLQCCTAEQGLTKHRQSKRKDKTREETREEKKRKEKKRKEKKRKEKKRKEKKRKELCQMHCKRVHRQSCRQFMLHDYGKQCSGQAWLQQGCLHLISCSLIFGLAAQE